MAILHQTWETITFAYFDGMLDDEELYDANKTWNAEFKYCEYQEFDISINTMMMSVMPTSGKLPQYRENCSCSIHSSVMIQQA